MTPSDEQGEADIYSYRIKVNTPVRILARRWAKAPQARSRASSTRHGAEPTGMKMVGTLRLAHPTFCHDTPGCHPRASGDPALFRKYEDWWLWVPAFAGTTVERENDSGARRRQSKSCHPATATRGSFCNALSAQAPL